ncbi:hypothetical protein BGZ80_002191 [Entomortierella chlamydospora]|uniref:RlpA-like protein double-psi beta-barrel domain-containing protein n=1 Tax=Entomortierella chlamydospora TaxID=101097 RepID=A0A9P6MQT0_9FUNG|nr:hypothetical protein BGZ79_010683 [Entomortierella chlamydospora]KAG0009658.1 hypothetical protein BGZ80_002191 [Entomortierella chlamydospora]
MKFAQLSVLIMAMVIAFVSLSEAKSSDEKKKQTVKFGKKISGHSTWFNGHDLKAVACYGDLENNSHVNAKDDWHIGAVHMDFYKSEKSVCFECVKITANKKNKKSATRSIVVRIIDDCAGCHPTQIDLTASAFKQLATLDDGVVYTEYEFVRCPSKGSLKWPKSPKPLSH